VERSSLRPTWAGPVGLPFAWFTADEAYGDNGKLREWLEKEGICHVVAVARDTTVPAGAGRTIRADQLAARVPGKGWQRLSCGHGSKGERLYDWAISPAGPGRHLLVRRSPGSGELAFYLCWSPRAAPLAELVKVAGARWAIEECFQAAKNEAALDHYQVRKHVAWYRHVTLALAAQAWLAAAAARPPGALPGSGPGEGGRAREGPATCGQLPGPPPPWSSRTVTGSDGQAMTCLSMNEIRRMHAALCRPAHPPGHYLHWSAWRRRHQATARRCHYQRRLKRGY
jgi:Transposase DDE domain